MLIDKFKIEIYNELRERFDITDISNGLSKFIISNYGAQLISIYILDGESELRRIVIEGKNLSKESAFDYFDKFFMPLKNSLVGHCIDKAEIFEYSDKYNIKFDNYLKDKSANDKIHLESFKILLKDIIKNNNNDTIRNYTVVPIINNHPQSNSSSLPWFDIRLGITIINIDASNKVKEVLSLIEFIKPLIFNAIAFRNSREEVEINRKVKQLENEEGELNNLISRIQDEFNQKLKSNLSHFWYFDNKSELLSLNNLKIYNADFVTINSTSTISALDIINEESIRVLKSSDSIFKELLSSQQDFIKIDDLRVYKNLKWKPIIKKFNASKLIAFPFNSNNIIGLLCFHPTCTSTEFNRINCNYYAKYLKQSSIVFKNFINVKINESTKAVNERIGKLSSKERGAEKIFNETLFKIKELIDCEACSLFRVRSDKIILVATTDRTKRSRIGKKIHDVNKDSICGTCAQTKKVINIFTTNDIKYYYSHINKRSAEFVENVGESAHRTLLFVPYYNKSIGENDHFIIKAVNKINPVPKNCIRIINFNEIDIEVLKYAGSIFNNFQSIFSSNKARNKLLSLLLHEIESPIKTLRSKTRKIELTNNSLSSLVVNSKEKYTREQLVNEVYLGSQKATKVSKDIYRNLEVIRGWSSSVETINALFQGNKISVNESMVNLYQSIEDIINWSTNLIKRYNRTKEDINISQVSANLVVWADQSHIYQIIRNIFENSLKYSSSNTREDIIIESISSHRSISIMFKDYGIGINEKEEDKIFDREFRSEEVKNMNYKGQGYGLWLSKKLAEANNSKIELISTRNPTIFKLTLNKKI